MGGARGHRDQFGLDGLISIGCFDFRLKEVITSMGTLIMALLVDLALRNLKAGSLGGAFVKLAANA